MATGLKIALPPRPVQVKPLKFLELAWDPPLRSCRSSSAATRRHCFPCIQPNKKDMIQFVSGFPLTFPKGAMFRFTLASPAPGKLT